MAESQNFIILSNHIRHKTPWCSNWKKIGHGRYQKTLHRYPPWPIIDNNDIATRQFQIINSGRIEGMREKEGKCLMPSVSDDDCESNYEKKARISIRTSSAYIVDQTMSLSMRTN